MNAPRHALVCGASMGIGRAAAEALAARGFTITALARSADKLADTVQACLAAGAPAARTLVADLDDREPLALKVHSLVKQHGPVHVLVNNTGGPPSGPILEADETAFLQTFARHVLAGHLLVRTLLPGMAAEGWGRIVNVISISVREPIPNLGVSNTIRGAMASWSKTVAGELPPGVTINNVLPGYTDTERLAELADELNARTGKDHDTIRAEWLEHVPEGRLARPEEIGAAIAWLASDDAAYVRGQSLAVDGGRLRGI